MLQYTSFYALGKYCEIQDIKSNLLYRIPVEKRLFATILTTVMEKAMHCKFECK